MATSAKIMPDLYSTYPKAPMSNFTDSLISYVHIVLPISSFPHLQRGDHSEFSISILIFRMYSQTDSLWYGRYDSISQLNRNFDAIDPALIPPSSPSPRIPDRTFVVCQPAMFQNC